jgi:ent-kaurene synthase
MKFQRKNGSLFSTPSTTAVALIHKYNDQALQYLNLLVNEFGSAGVMLYFSISQSF